MIVRPIPVMGVFIALLASACFPKDERVPPYPGQVTTIADSNQVYQSYFDFEAGRVVKTVTSKEWQLGFECGASGWHIITNSGGFWFIYNTHQPELDQSLVMPDGVAGLYDNPETFPDSTAVGNWVTLDLNGNTYSHDVYLLGRQQNNVFTDIKQIIFLEVNDTSYKFLYKNSSDNYYDTVSITKSDTLNFVYYSFGLKSTASIEPDKNSFDLVFAPYYDIATLFGATIPYHVGGSYLNMWNTSAVLDTSNSYSSITYESLPDYEFTSQRNIPGYLWKSVNVDVSGGGLAYYKVHSNYTYIFHTAQNNYFKLRFLSYNLNGNNGFPQFEYRQLTPANQ